MTYIEGFVAAVPTARRDDYVKHAQMTGAVFAEHGARRVVEGWGTDVAPGKLTDFRRAVQAQGDETVVFSWIEWPDKATRDAGMADIETAMKSDPRFDPAINPMPFDGARMIYGGFDAFVEHGQTAGGAYVQGFVVPVPISARDAYRTMANSTWDWFQEHGAQRTFEAWSDDVPHGKRTDFYRAVQASEGEAVVFAFTEWPSREVCDAAAIAMQTDERMKPPPKDEIPFDASRLIYGGFETVLELKA